MGYSQDSQGAELPFNRSAKELWQHHNAVEMSLWKPDLCGGVGAREEGLEEAAKAIAQEYRQEFIDQWNELDLDVMLCPTLCPAFTIGYPGKLSVAISYAVLYNMLNFPAGVVPVTTVTNEDEEELRHYEGYYKDPWDKLFRKAVEGSVGLPVAVQCVALPWQEEMCLRLMKEVETLARKQN